MNVLSGEKMWSCDEVGVVRVGAGAGAVQSLRKCDTEKDPTSFGSVNGDLRVKTAYFHTLVRYGTTHHVREQTDLHASQ